VPIFSRLPAVHTPFEQIARFVQHFATVVPSTPFFSESLYLSAGQVTVAPRHLVVSRAQHVLSSEEVHCEPAQRKDAKLVFNFLPREHLIVEHNAWREQQLVISFGVVVFRVTTSLFFVMSLYFMGPHVTDDSLHVMMPCVQHRPSSEVAHVAPAQYKLAWLVT
jgi:hypothetical protein